MRNERSEWSVPCSKDVMICFQDIGESGMNKENNKKRKKLSAEEKWRIYQMCQQPGAKIGEILRSYGLYSSELQKIRQTVEQGALESLRQSRPGRKKKENVSIAEHERLQRELEEKEKALAEMTVLFTTLKKKVNLE